MDESADIACKDCWLFSSWSQFPSGLSAISRYIRVQSFHDLFLSAMKIFTSSFLARVFPKGENANENEILAFFLNLKQLLDEVFVISRIIKVEVSVISRSLRLRLMTLTETLIILDITKKPNLIIVLLYIVLRKITTNALSCFHIKDFNTWANSFLSCGSWIFFSLRYL